MIRLVMMLAAVVATPRQGIDRPVEFLQFEQVRDRLVWGFSCQGVFPPWLGSQSADWFIGFC